MISIIVPIYNAEKTICHCIDSILCQNIKSEEYEVILIDDGSTDQTAKICKMYTKNSNVFYFYQQNQGASAARNQGIKKSRGEWLIFVDSDDMMESDFLKIALDKIKTKSDLYIFNIKSQNRIYDFDNITIASFQNKVRLIESICGIRNRSKIRLPGVASPFAKIYSRSLIIHSDIKFDERIIIAEDMLFNICVILEAARIECINEAVYKYVKNPISLMNTYHATDLTHDEFFLMEYKKIVEKYPELKKAYEYSFMNSFVTFLGRDFANSSNHKTYQERKSDFKKLLTNVRPYSTENYRKIYKNRKQMFGIKKRIIIGLLVYHNIYLALLIYKMNRCLSNILQNVKKGKNFL